MLDSIKQWFATGAGQAAWLAVSDWAHGQGYEFKRSRDGDGFIIDHAGPATPWRLEWGPSQRRYIGGPELRLRAELGAGGELQMMVITRLLMEALEKQVFEDYTENLQTRMDTSTPEEMRWLVLHGKVPAVELGALREHYAGIGLSVTAVAQWLDGPLAAALAQARATWLAAGDPLLLIVQRGRITLRAAQDTPDTTRMGALVDLFTVATAEARRVAQQWDAGGGGMSTPPSQWSGSVLDPNAPGKG
jgi:hypothetical protein